MSTLPPYIALEPNNREALFEALKVGLEKAWGKTGQTEDFSAVYWVRKI
ncbi:hypothetical protein [Myxacorys almedinensis]|uniref:Uncharacterized protein n=1 Tax=Myxacorys almedinensis A TaxID=2690445 RepID=A0A8J7Z2H8_9CYAN|nr:hypothetical protein [Myxacorys almedinensis]NDJ18832.1 hypothetical protein [Myxacorys almedinensis A]